MRSNPAASTFMSALLWSMLFVSMFAAPVLMAARSADGGPDEHTADLIRQHQDATSPYSPAPASEAEQLDSRACGRPEDGSAVAGEGTARRSARPDDEPVIRPAANRAKRIQV